MAENTVDIGLYLAHAKLITFQYVNYAGVSSKRTILPLRLQYGTTAFYPNPIMLLQGFCMDRKAHRTFAIEHMSNVELAP